MARPEPPDPGLPIKLEPCTNGEYAPPPPTELAREVVRRANAAVDRNARRVGLSRREFLLSAMGAATTLSVLSACTREFGQTGGTFDVDPSTTGSSRSTTADSASTATTDEEEAADAVGPLHEEFIFDVQGHLLEFGPDVAAGDPGFPQSACGEADPRDCYGIDHFLDLVFGRSDTHTVMLSAIPFAPGALSPEVMERAMAAADSLGCADRVLMQGESFPTATVGSLTGIEAMVEVAANYPIRAFKTYTHAGGPSWRLDDDTGDAYLAQVERLGVPIVAVHKGLSGNNAASSPVDVGPAASNHPDVSLLVYHSGYETGLTEGPYDPAAAGTGSESGVDRLLSSLRASGIGAGGNVYAELGSTWRTLMTRPDEAAHVLGKLLASLGPDNVLWGTDSIWYGSPQDQIEAFRTFQISDEFQERFGYPALTDETKRKILGYNAARVFAITPDTSACDIDRSEVQAARAERIGTHHTHASAGLDTYRRSMSGPSPAVAASHLPRS